MPVPYSALPASAAHGSRAIFTSYNNVQRHAIMGASGYWEVVGGPEAPMETAMLRFSVLANSNADDNSLASPKLQNAINSLLVEGQREVLHFPPGLDIRMSYGITCDICAGLFRWNGSRLRCDLMTSGAAVTLGGQSAYPYNQLSAAMGFENLVIELPGTDSTVVDGIVLGDGSTVTGHAAIRDVVVTGGRDQYTFGDHCYVQKLENCHGLFAHRRALAYYGTTDTGESILLDGGNYSSAHNASGDAVGIYVPDGNGPNLRLKGTSNDFCDLGWYVGGGAFLGEGAHFESRTNSPHGQCKATGGGASTLIELLGCTVIHGTTVEDAGGRPTFFLIDSATGDRLTFIGRGTRYGGYQKVNTEFVTYAGSGNPKIVVDDHHCEQAFNLIGKVCNRTSRLSGNWSTSGSNSYQEFDVDPGKTAIVRMLVDNGRLPSVIFSDKAGNTLATKTLTAQTTGMTGYPEPSTGANRSAAYRAPEGAYSARLQIATAQVGDVSNAQAWVV